MIVYSLVILVLMVKLDSTRKRKVLYAAIGAVGTYFVNVIRITLIVLYVTYVSLNFEAFHASIGEVLFIAWIFIYLLAVIRYENLHPGKPIPAPAPKQPKLRGLGPLRLLSRKVFDESRCLTRVILSGLIQSRGIKGDPSQIRIEPPLVRIRKFLMRPLTHTT
jgi:exosortase/archaeosortase family protein